MQFKMFKSVWKEPKSYLLNEIVYMFNEKRSYSKQYFTSTSKIFFYKILDALMDLNVQISIEYTKIIGLKFKACQMVMVTLYSNC